MQSKCHRHSSKNGGIICIEKSIDPSASVEGASKNPGKAQSSFADYALDKITRAANPKLLWERRHMLSPVDNLINDFSLLCRSLSQINACSFDALVTHEISQERDIIAPLQETFSETMPERVRIHNKGIDFIANSQFL